MPHRLDRPPHDAGAPEMLEVTELPYAKALEATAFKPGGFQHPPGKSHGGATSNMLANGHL